MTMKEMTVEKKRGKVVYEMFLRENRQLIDKIEEFQFYINDNEDIKDEDKELILQMASSYKRYLVQLSQQARDVLKQIEQENKAK